MIAEVREISIGVSQDWPELDQDSNCVPSEHYR